MDEDSIQAITNEKMGNSFTKNIILVFWIKKSHTSGRIPNRKELAYIHFVAQVVNYGKDSIALWMKNNHSDLERFIKLMKSTGSKNCPKAIELYPPNQDNIQ